jgi:phosphodiesterase/alkaline phosphatase D-like protein
MLNPEHTVDDNSTYYYNFATTADTVLPQITFDPATGITNVTDTKASISWSTSKSTNAQVSFGTTSGSYPLSSNDTNLNYDHTINLTGLTPNKTYYFKLTNIDENNNTVNSSEYSFTTQVTADTTGPRISAVTVTNTTPTSATITWTTDENSSSFIEYANTKTNFSSIYKEFGKESDAITNHTVTIEGLTQNTIYYYTVTSLDAAGNKTTDNNSNFDYSVTTASGPAINNVTATTPTLTSAVISWTTNSNSDGDVIYSDNSNFFNSQEKGATDKTSTSHNITLTGLTSGTTYYYKVRSTGTNSGVTTDDNNGTDYSFTAASDVTPPVISLISTDSVSYNSAVVKWTTDEPATSQLQYGLTAGNLNNLTTLNSNLNIDHAVVLSGLEAVSTTYYFKVISKDSSGNTSSDNSVNN